jgi:hypothetical protein
LRKATASIVTSVCPQLVSHWTDFHKI